MAYFDLDKNSLPEQVQKNKDDIKELDAAKIDKSIITATGSMIIGAMHDMPAELLAGNEGDILKMHDGVPEWQAEAEPEITADNVDSETATAGQVLTADGNGGASWEDPAQPEITASDVDSETATSGQVLQADGSGGASWQTVSADSLTLLWSGSLLITSGTSASVSINPLAYSRTLFVFQTNNASYTYSTMVYGQQLSVLLKLGTPSQNAIASMQLNISGSSFTISNRLEIGFDNTTGTPSVLSTNFTLKEIYEVK